MFETCILQSFESETETSSMKVPTHKFQVFKGAGMVDVLYFDLFDFYRE